MRIMNSLFPKRFLYVLFVIIMGLTSVISVMAEDDFYLNNMISPQVTDMFRYGNVETSLFTGKLNLSVPIYQLEDPDFNLNIALRYHSEGFKPNKQSGYVGYNWFLEAGGCITREVKNFADELSRNDAHNSFRYTGMLSYVRENKLNKEQIYTFDRNVFNEDYQLGEDYYHDVDYLPDIFHFNFCGYSGSFIVNNQGEVTILNGDFLQVDLSGLLDIATPNDGYITEPNCSSQIIVTTNDGYMYIFGGDLSALEYTLSIKKEEYLIPLQNAPIINSWHLREIIAANGRRVTFHYKNLSHNILSCDNLMVFNEYYDQFAEVPETQGAQNDPVAHLRYSILKESILDSIVVHGLSSLKIDFINHVDSCKLYPDSYSSGEFILDKVRISSAGRLLRTAQLNCIHKYSTDVQQNIANYWRFLSSVDVSGIGVYTMGYHHGSYPHIQPLDSWYNNDLDSYGYWKANSSLGLLNSIVFPTGGKQEFSYEKHDYGKDKRFKIDGSGNVELQILDIASYLPGVRLYKIKTFQNSTIPIEERTYSYKQKESAASSGIFYNNLGVFANNGHTDYCYITKDSYSLINTHIGYSSVEERIQLFDNNESSYKVIYSFNTGQTSYTSNNSNTINRLNQNNISNQSLSAEFAGVLSYDDKLSTIGHLVEKDYYVANTIVQSELFKYRSVAINTLIPNPENSSTTRTSGITDTIVIFSRRFEPVTRKLFVCPIVCEQEVNKEFHLGNHLYVSKSHQYDNKLRKKEEIITNSDNLEYFKRYTYPDDVVTGSNVTDGPYYVLTQLNQIKDPVEIVSGYKLNNQEYITTSVVNIYTTGQRLLDSLQSPSLNNRVIAFKPTYSYLSETIKLESQTGLKEYMPVQCNNDGTLNYGKGYQTICRYKFDSNYRLIEFTPVNNVTTTYTWDGIYPISKTVGNQISTYTYIPYVGMSSATDARGVTIYYEYDIYGRLIEVYRLNNGKKEILNKYIYHIQAE